MAGGARLFFMFKAGRKVLPTTQRGGDNPFTSSYSRVCPASLFNLSGCFGGLIEDEAPFGHPIRQDP